MEEVEESVHSSDADTPAQLQSGNRPQESAAKRGVCDISAVEGAVEDTGEDNSFRWSRGAVSFS